MTSWVQAIRREQNKNSKINAKGADALPQPSDRAAQTGGQTGKVQRDGARAGFFWHKESEANTVSNMSNSPTTKTERRARPRAFRLEGDETVPSKPASASGAELIESETDAFAREAAELVDRGGIGVVRDANGTRKQSDRAEHRDLRAADLIGPASAERADDGAHQGHRQDQQRRLNGAISPHALQVEDQQEVQGWYKFQKDNKKHPYEGKREEK